MTDDSKTEHRMSGSATARNRRLPASVAVLAAAALVPLAGQGGRGAPAPTAQEPAPTAQASAPIDLTGYFVSIVSEDWRWRMVTPPKGEYSSVPITEEAKKLADAWDPDRDAANGEQCRAYGAAGLMRQPTRLHITWQDETTLKVETDAGMQTRLFHFGDWKASGGPPTWQGESKAEWEVPGGRGRGRGDGGGPRFGNLKVVTTNMRPGYLRKNGVPYGNKATLSEYWDTVPTQSGDLWLVVTTYVDDPDYLRQRWITSLNFLKEPDGSKWNPQPCSAT